jgi:hypothetical protein
MLVSRNRMIVRVVRMSSAAVFALAITTAGVGCSSMTQGASSDGAQVGQAAGQYAGSAAARSVPFGGLLGSIAGRHAGQAAGSAIEKSGQQKAQTASAQVPAGQ